MTVHILPTERRPTRSFILAGSADSTNASPCHVYYMSSLALAVHCRANTESHAKARARMCAEQRALSWLFAFLFLRSRLLTHHVSLPPSCLALSPCLSLNCFSLSLSLTYSLSLPPSLSLNSLALSLPLALCPGGPTLPHPQVQRLTARLARTEDALSVARRREQVNAAHWLAVLCSSSHRGHGAPTHTHTSVGGSCLIIPKTIHHATSNAFRCRRLCVTDLAKGR